jgi:hypothetical protein
LVTDVRILRSLYERKVIAYSLIDLAVVEEVTALLNGCIKNLVLEEKYVLLLFYIRVEIDSAS